ncbi:MAG: ABC transporter ATP-binding protein [Candidatus Hecatellaceae archaeon]
MLEVVKVVKSFYGLRALDSVNLKVEKGSMVGLIGPNGSGKTTLFNVISGVYKPDEGEIYLNGEKIAGLTPHEICGKGLGRSFQQPRLFKEMTVLENIMVSARSQKGESLSKALTRSWLEEEARLAKKAFSILRFLQLERLAFNPASNISAGQARLLEIAKVLMGDPQIALLDEPTGGVAPRLSEKIFDYIRKINREFGVTFLIIEHKLGVLFDYVDYVYLMDRGKIVLEGKPEEVAKSSTALEVYFGG